MRLFWSVAPPPDPQPKQEHIHHHHGPSYTGLALVAVLVLAGGLWSLERWLVGLLAAMEIDNPQGMFGLLLWSALLGIPGLLLANWIAHGWARARHERAMEKAEKRLQLLELQHRLQTSVVSDSGVLSPSERRRNALITAICVDAYAHIQEHGKFGPRDRNPWARRNAGQYVLAGESDPVGENSATVTEAVQWLKSNRVITGPAGREQVNLDQYPNLAAVQRALHLPPVLNGKVN